MQENMKTAALIFLILLSMGLTYHIWFGTPPLKEGAAPKYEYSSFAEPHSLKDIVTPSKIIFRGEETDVFRRGEEEHLRLWMEGNLLVKRLGKQALNRISDSEKESMLESASPQIIFLFSIPLPLDFLLPWFTSPEVNIHRAAVILEEHYYSVIFEGGDIFAGRIFMNPNEQLLNSLVPRGSCPHFCLSDEPALDFLKSGFQETENDNASCEEGPDAEETREQGRLSDSEEEKEEVNLSLSLRNRDSYVPLENFSAAEILLKKESADRDELVKAFFLDPSMARLIEERDGAIFFTDGEKGLRIYPDGLVEYTAPKLEHISASVPYDAALQKGAENLAFYGGWPQGTYLVRAEKQSKGYRLFWETFYAGLPVVGNHVGSEMVISDRGLLFYQRNFYQFVEETGEKKAFRPFAEALGQAVLIYQETLAQSEGVLLGIEPVYYLSSPGKGVVKAIPAWAVSLSGLETLYLHWQTLEPL